MLQSMLKWRKSLIYTEARKQSLWGESSFTGIFSPKSWLRWQGRNWYNRTWSAVQTANICTWQSSCVTWGRASPSSGGSFPLIHTETRATTKIWKNGQSTKSSKIWRVNANMKQDLFSLFRVSNNWQTLTSKYYLPDLSSNKRSLLNQKVLKWNQGWVNSITRFL